MSDRLSESSEAVYRQIADQIQEQIDTGELKSGDRLQSERQMSQELGVNRLTVRRAFNVLVERGLIDRRHGGGTFVSTPRIERFADRLVPFLLAMREKGLTPGAEVITYEQDSADDAMAGLLCLKSGAPIIHIYRVRTIDGEPAMLEQMYFSAELLPNFNQFDHNKRSGYEIMETEYGVSVVRADQSLEAVVATAYEAELLGISAGNPLMLERRLTYDVKGRPVEYGKDLYRGDLFNFVTTEASLALSYSKDN